MSDAAVVRSAIRDCLSPSIRTILQTDPTLPKRLRGDPDDIETLAVAELLAPSIILSADSVFTRFGFSNTTAETWVGTAYSLLHMAGFEATVADAAMVAELGGRLLFETVGSMVRWAQHHPIITTIAIGVFAFIGLRRGWFDRERLRAALRSLRSTVEPIAGALGEAYSGWAGARKALHVVEPYGEPTVEQAAARHLARRGRPLTPSDLRDELRTRGYRATAKALKAAMDSHPAFVRSPNDLYSVGVPARLLGRALRPRLGGSSPSESGAGPDQRVPV
jgi:hypothetical protein